MTDEEQIKQVLYDFENNGLVTGNIDNVLNCLSDQIIGIGMGEQGFVSSREEIKAIIQNESREEDSAGYSLSYDQLNILIHDGKFANICADISISRKENDNVTQSHLLQSLVLIKQDNGWKICGLHASAPALTMENVESYPLRYAENMLKDLRAKIGEEAYQAEEQYRKAVLSDMVAFYIINFTGNYFEQCQINSDMCAYTEPGTPYDEFTWNNLADFVAPEYQAKFWKKFSLDSIRQSIDSDEKEISCEYELRRPDGSCLWMVSVIRLIEDCVTGEHKGIMYVKDIDKQKRRELEMKAKAELDQMTGIYNRTAFIQHIDELLGEDGVCRESESPILLMIDLDNFKSINDSFGHPFGDHVLVEACRLLRECFGEKCLLGRLGGDEFGVLVPRGVCCDQIREQSARLVNSLEAIAVPKGSSLRVSCSIGACACKDAASFPLTYHKADKALYKSKRDGGKCCSFYHEMA